MSKICILCITILSLIILALAIFLTILAIIQIRLNKRIDDKTRELFYEKLKRERINDNN